MAVLQSLVLMTVTLAGVYCLCSEDKIKQFNELWNNNPPTDVLQNSVGKSTYLWVSKSAIGDPSVISCLQTELAQDKMSANDIGFFTSSTDPMSAPYNMVMEEPGVLTKVLPSQSDLFMYVVYQKNDVIAYYQCSRRNPNFQSGVGILVKNYDSSKNVEADVEAAKKILTDMELFEDVVQLETKCPS